MSRRPTRPRPRGRPSNANPAARDDLLDAAIALFAQHGVAATTLAQVAGKVGVTPAMVHYYFRNRDQLVDAVVEERLARVAVYIWGAVDQSERDPLALVTGIVHRFVEAAEAAPWLPSLWIREVVNESGLLRQRIVQRLPMEKFKHIGDTITAAKRKGTVSADIDPVLIIVSIVGLSLLPLATSSVWRRFPGAGPIGSDALVRHVTALLHGGLAKQRGRSTPRRK